MRRRNSYSKAELQVTVHVLKRAQFVFNLLGSAGRSDAHFPD